MSVILFSKGEVYQEMADAYEGLKHLLFQPVDSERDERFYKSLRRLYFANVAAFLCQYHDDSPLAKEELGEIDPFQELQGKRSAKGLLLQADYAQLLEQFLEAWSSLQYNLTTNDGEEYRALQGYECIEEIAQRLSVAVATHLKQKAE